MKEIEFVPVKKILSIINSCENESHLKSTKKIIQLYIDQVKNQGVINTELLQKRLEKEYKQKYFQIKMIKLFIQQNKIEFFTVHKEKKYKIIA